MSARLGDIGAELPIFTEDEIAILSTLREWSKHPHRTDDLDIISHQELAIRAGKSRDATLSALVSLRRHFLTYGKRAGWRLTKLGAWVWDNKLSMVTP